MGTKIDELEKSVNDLMDQAGIESTPSDNVASSSTAKPTASKR